MARIIHLLYKSTLPSLVDRLMILQSTQLIISTDIHSNTTLAGIGTPNGIRTFLKSMMNGKWTR